MLYLSFYLLIALISIYAIKPKSNKLVLLSSILVPISIFIAQILIFLLIFSSYEAGSKSANAILPAILSGFVIYFQLVKKMQSPGRLKFPIILVVAIALSLIIGIYTLILEYQINQFI